MKYDFYITGTIGVAFDWFTGQRGTTANMVKHFLEEHKDQEVNIAVSSPGGYLNEGITIGEYIASHGKCNMVIVGMTASAATLLCMKAKSVQIAKGSLMLIHNSMTAINLWGMANKQAIDELITRLAKGRDDLDTFDKAAASIYSHRNGKSIEENMAMMDKEKWMADQECVDFGIADSILDEEESNTNVKAIQNVYSSMEGIENHFSLPRFPEMEKPDRRSLMTRLKGIMNEIHNFVAGEEPKNGQPVSSTNNSSTTMKKIILNLVCALLAVQDIELDAEKGTVNLTEAQLNAIENDLKEKADKISALETEKATAVSEKEAAATAKAEAEDKLAKLQKEFDDFKAEAGGDTLLRPNSKASKEPKNSKELYESIKSLL